ncbi:F0F1 ATP synthase subunit B' [Rhodospirillum rubrum]|uniref:F0F1 ATP synthase subunit B family protein n=1 Tax=Rhodospirillum rubrum TaxID=1085 RepID=UPI0019074631|nr:F0F1 ATP synthase subunit B' [Rhodospirillum rubrum]MBK1665603.1 F0F1 ATP synthase subunit B' [Rhodospirillum rubrum]MBK1677651.1 F0F1 ATP synthase subunit B' [Rhodospirillum rubrum]
MPQFDPSSFPSQIVWLVIALVAMYFVMSRLAIPRLAEVLEQRQRLVNDDLKQAEALKAETEAAIAAYETALAEARARAHDEIRAVTEAATKAAEARNAEVAKALNTRIKDGEARIVQARDEALTHVREVAGAVASDMVGKLAGLRVDDAALNAAVAAATKE